MKCQVERRKESSSLMTQNPTVKAWLKESEYIDVLSRVIWESWKGISWINAQQYVSKEITSRLCTLGLMVQVNEG